MTQRTMKRLEALEAATTLERDRLIIVRRIIGSGDPNRTPIGVEASTHLPPVDIREGETDDEFFARLLQMAAHLPESLPLSLRFRYAPEGGATDEGASNAS
jgi:hypothetical protein